jgi:2-polyprenyl-3-methyl-5-hydroxy-6-metoxy-1,4-benzoquinol methylase
MKLIKRSKSALNHADNLEIIHELRDFPVFMGCVNQSKSEDLHAHQVWAICRETGFIQLQNLIPLEILYQDQHQSGVVGNIWMKHHAAFAKFLHQYEPNRILEVGGAHGILSKEYERYGQLPWTILEPNPAPVEGCQAHFIKGFFDENFSSEEKFDTVVHSHVFEHIYEPDLFMAKLADFMSLGCHLVFSIPNIQVMLERKYTNAINFEHTTCLTEPYVEYLLSMYGFKLLSKEYFMDDHSIFYAAIRDNDVKKIQLTKKLYLKNKNLYLDFVDYYHKLVKEINNKIKYVEQPVYLFGAHVFAQYLIVFGLDISRIAGLLDNDPNKRAKRLYGTSLMVDSPKILSQIKDPIVILKAGVYSNEIKNDILSNINAGTIFLE